jgi:hypothetical protein
MGTGGNQKGSRNRHGSVDFDEEKCLEPYLGNKGDRRVGHHDALDPFLSSSGLCRTTSQTGPRRPITEVFTMRTKNPSTPKNTHPKPQTTPLPVPIPGSSASTAAPAGAVAPSGAASPPTATPTVAAAVSVSRTRSNARTQILNVLVALVTGLRANFAPTDTFDLPSGTFTVEELIAPITALLALVSNVTTTGAAYHQAVEQANAASKSALALRAQVKAVLEARLGKSTAALTVYGFTPAKVAVRTAKSKMTAVVKSEATRVARGTKGSVEKLAITGNVTGIGITPIVASATPPTGAAGSTPAAPVATVSTTHS